jgi:hypothetical protein
VTYGSGSFATRRRKRNVSRSETSAKKASSTFSTIAIARGASRAPPLRHSQPASASIGTVDLALDEPFALEAS